MDGVLDSLRRAGARKPILVVLKELPTHLDGNEMDAGLMPVSGLSEHDATWCLLCSQQGGSGLAMTVAESRAAGPEIRGKENPETAPDGPNNLLWEQIVGGSPLY